MNKEMTWGFTLETVLSADALFFDAARQQLEGVNAHQPALAAAEAAVRDQQSRLELMSKAAEDEDDTRSRTWLWVLDVVMREGVEDLDEYEKRDFSADYEQAAIEMENICYDLSEAHSQLIRGYALVHILSAAALEAHINALARGRLGGVERDEFLQLSLKAKWIFLPKLLAGFTFNAGAQPFQGFSDLVRYRNDLMHYKLRAEPWRSGEAPEFLKTLGLTYEAATASFTSATEMIGTLADKLGERRPYWLEKEAGSYFDV